LEIPVVEFIPPRLFESVDVSSIATEYNEAENKLYREATGGYDEWLSTLPESGDGRTRFTAKIFFRNASGDEFVSNIEGQRHWLENKLRFTLRKIEPTLSNPDNSPSEPYQ
jgi:hypothetical protein